MSHPSIRNALSCTVGLPCGARGVGLAFARQSGARADWWRNSQLLSVKPAVLLSGAFTPCFVPAELIPRQP